MAKEAGFGVLGVYDPHSPQEHPEMHAFADRFVTDFGELLASAGE